MEHQHLSVIKLDNAVLNTVTQTQGREFVPITCIAYQTHEETPKEYPTVEPVPEQLK